MTEYEIRVVDNMTVEILNMYYNETEQAIECNDGHAHNWA
jgi:hypothetical protein